MLFCNNNVARNRNEIEAVTDYRRYRFISNIDNNRPKIRCSAPEKRKGHSHGRLPGMWYGVCGVLCFVWVCMGRRRVGCVCVHVVLCVGCWWCVCCFVVVVRVCVVCGEAWHKQIQSCMCRCRCQRTTAATLLGKCEQGGKQSINQKCF